MGTWLYLNLKRPHKVGRDKYGESTLGISAQGLRGLRAFLRDPGWQLDPPGGCELRHPGAAGPLDPEDPGLARSRGGARAVEPHAARALGAIPPPDREPEGASLGVLDEGDRGGPEGTDHQARRRHVQARLRVEHPRSRRAASEAALAASFMRPAWAI